MIARSVVASAVLLVGGVCAGDDKKDDKKGDEDQLQGEWAVVSVAIGGKEVELFKGEKLVVKGGEWILPAGGTSKLRFRLDAAKSPKQLDLTADFGGGELTTPGIYKIEGDTHTLCLPTGLGGVRPKEFKSVEGVTLMVFKRAEKK